MTLRHVSNGRVTASRSITAPGRRMGWRQVKLALRTGSRAGRVQVLLRTPGARTGALRTRYMRVTRTARATTTPRTPTRTETLDTTRWAPDLSEDFDFLDPNRWNVANDTARANENSHLLARNTTVADGALRIQGKRESAGGRDYTSGYVTSNGKYELPNYFRAQVRAKVPMQQGLWAAPLWLRPVNGGDGEIDLVETYGRERANPRVHQVIHTEYGDTHRDMLFDTPFSAVSTAHATDWHVYTVEKVPNRITMWVDGVQTAVFTPGSPAWYSEFYEAGTRWNLRINMQIGGAYSGLPDSTNNWAADASAMQLDYIKTWTLK